MKTREDKKKYLKAWRTLHKKEIKEDAEKYREENWDRIKLAHNKYRKKFKDSGICLDCRKNPSISKGGRCADCLEMNKMSSQKIRDVAKESGICGFCKQNKIIDGTTLCPGCKKYKRDQRARLKLEIFDYYGGPICACCGEDREPFLSLDHIKGGGYAHRKELRKSTETLYRWVKKNNFPPGFQVLCMSCNFEKRDKETCFHSTENRFVVTASGIIGEKSGVLDVEKAVVALGKICRYAGNCLIFWTVLQHSLVVSDLAPENLKLLALVHDMAETAISDVPKPFKVPELKNIERKIQKRLYESIGLHPSKEDLETLKSVDERALQGEVWTVAADELKPFYPNRDKEAERLVMKYVNKFTPQDNIEFNGKAVVDFIQRFKQLTGE